MKWIDVKQELPPKGKIVLVFDDQGYPDIGYLEVDKESGLNRWSNESGTQLHPLFWMYLPNSPDGTDYRWDDYFPESQKIDPNPNEKVILRECTSCFIIDLDYIDPNSAPTPTFLCEFCKKNAPEGEALINRILDIMEKTNPSRFPQVLRLLHKYYLEK